MVARIDLRLIWIELKYPFGFNVLRPTNRPGETH